jgi:hypothetical protein
MNNKSKDQLEAGKLIEDISKKFGMGRWGNELVRMDYTFTTPEKYAQEFDVKIEEFYIKFMESKKA